MLERMHRLRGISVSQTWRYALAYRLTLMPGSLFPAATIQGQAEAFRQIIVNDLGDNPHRSALGAPKRAIAIL